MIKPYTKQEFFKKYGNYTIYTKVEDIPQYIYDIMYNENVDDETYRGVFYDYITPLEKGLDWLFEYIYKYQPKTGEILKNAKNLFVAIDETAYHLGGNIYNSHLMFELNGKLLKIEREFYDGNLCDSLEVSKIIKNEVELNDKNIKYVSKRACSINRELLLAYYYRFSGFGFPVSDWSYLRTLPQNMTLLSNLDDLLVEYDYKKKDRKKYIDYIEKLLYKTTGKNLNPLKLYSFMNTLYFEIINENDYAFFIHQGLKFGDIYVVKNGDVAGIRRLKNPVKAIDEYVAYVLTTYETDFDFEPYLEEIPGKPEFVEEEYKEFEIEKINISKLNKKYINEVMAQIDYLSLSSHISSEVYYRIKTKDGVLSSNYNRKSDIYHASHIDIDEIIATQEIETIELFGYSLIDDYDDMVEYRDGEEFDFSLYVKYMISKDKLEIIVPTIFKREVPIENLDEEFKEISKDIRVVSKTVEDDKYKDYYRYKIYKGSVSE
ncbi:hypothetical protein [Oceanivirga salmonicida]|uniref:hypothetical protein n=1 Tax=Oceanivirga salmonicida TaxID=1769291 RepID=UPI0012E16487|nr:hypothetical protein [Oceanivirga salmonicida]